MTIAQRGITGETLVASGLPCWAVLASKCVVIFKRGNTKNTTAATTRIASTIQHKWKINNNGVK
jgi:hypothetical protein